jgi:N-hydroxyarylamine O-acetyltransferase
MMDVDAYLERIGYRGSTRPTETILRRLHRRHMLSVPFENLDIPMHRPIILSQPAFYNKIVNHHRGGFCYELNGSFGNLLRRLGFRVSMLSARVARKNRGFSPEFDHMTLRVQLRQPWLADVGFGDSFTEPKRLDISDPQPDYGTEYRLTRKNEWILMSRRKKGSPRWEPQYKFTLRPRKLSDYVARCEWQQTSPRSHFTKNRLCTRATPNGRITLTDKEFILTRNGKKGKRSVKSPEEFTTLLQRRFGIDLG